MFLGLSDPHPDRKDRGTEPSIRIRTKMSRIHNTGGFAQYGTGFTLQEDNFSNIAKKKKLIVKAV
jgi:hypothetical protein